MSLKPMNWNSYCAARDLVCAVQKMDWQAALDELDQHDVWFHPDALGMALMYTLHPMDDINQDHRCVALQILARPEADDIHQFYLTRPYYHALEWGDGDLRQAIENCSNYEFVSLPPRQHEMVFLQDVQRGDLRNLMRQNLTLDRNALSHDVYAELLWCLADQIGARIGAYEYYENLVEEGWFRRESLDPHWVALQAVQMADVSRKEKDVAQWVRLDSFHSVSSFHLSLFLERISFVSDRAFGEHPVGMACLYRWALDHPQISDVPDTLLMEIYESVVGRQDVSTIKLFDNKVSGRINVDVHKKLFPYLNTIVRDVSGVLQSGLERMEDAVLDETPAVEDVQGTPLPATPTVGSASEEKEQAAEKLSLPALAPDGTFYH